MKAYQIGRNKSHEVERNKERVGRNKSWWRKNIGGIVEKRRNNS